VRERMPQIRLSSARTRRHRLATRSLSQTPRAITTTLGHRRQHARKSALCNRQCTPAVRHSCRASTAHITSRTTRTHQTHASLYTHTRFASHSSALAPIWHNQTITITALLSHSLEKLLLRHAGVCHRATMREPLPQQRHHLRHHRQTCART
jgi:hypothetical protein